MESSADSSPSSSTTTVPCPLSFANLFLNEINYSDVHNLRQVQRSLLEQLDKTNEKIDGINKLSAKHYFDASRDFSSHTQMLTTMKSDLDLIFKRIKLLKTRLHKKYPEAYSAAVQANAAQDNSLDDEEDDTNSLTTSMKAATHPSLVKSKTIDCSQLPPSIRESYSLDQLTNNNNTDFVHNESSDGNDLTT